MRPIENRKYESSSTGNPEDWFCVGIPLAALTQNVGYRLLLRPLCPTMSCGVSEFGDAVPLPSSRSCEWYVNDRLQRFLAFRRVTGLESASEGLDQERRGIRHRRGFRHYYRFDLEYQMYDVLNSFSFRDFSEQFFTGWCLFQDQVKESRVTGEFMLT